MTRANRKAGASSRIARRSPLELTTLANSIAMVLAVPLVATDAARAQEEPARAEPLDAIVVTGSRIVRRDFSANSPIMTVDRQAFDEQAAIAVEEALNRLPQFVPAATGYTQVQDGEL